MHSTDATMRSAESSGQLMVDDFLLSSASLAPPPSSSPPAPRYTAAEAEDVLFSMEDALAALEEAELSDFVDLLDEDEDLRERFKAAGAMRDALLDGDAAIEVCDSVVELLRATE